MLVAVDVESTGLNPHEGHLLLEVYAEIRHPAHPFNLVTDDAFHAVIRQDFDTAYGLADDFVKKMHAKTGLWGQLETEGIPLDQADAKLRNYLEDHLDQREGRVTGNSVRLDMNFMEAYLPKSLEWLHYRFLDVTGLSWFLQHNLGIKPYSKDTSGAHSASFDVGEMVNELAWNSKELSRLIGTRLKEKL